MYGTSVCFPTSAVTEQPSSGAAPPLVFKRWTNVVWDRSFPPVGPSSDPIEVSRRHGMAPSFGQLGCVPALIIAPSNTCAHTLLVSNELCHVALPKGITVRRP